MIRRMADLMWSHFALQQWSAAVTDYSADPLLYSKE